MYSSILNQLNSIREELTDIIDGKSEKLIDSTRSIKLKDEIQKNVLDMITQTIDEIDTIVDDIDNNEYDDEENYDY